jgi:hypothetical protein
MATICKKGSLRAAVSLTLEDSPFSHAFVTTGGRIPQRLSSIFPVSLDRF